jgi:hypothetical protein
MILLLPSSWDYRQVPLGSLFNIRNDAETIIVPIIEGRTNREGRWEQLSFPSAGKVVYK